MPSNEEIDKLIQLLDGQMQKGTKHVNVKCDDPSHIELEQTTVVSGMDCDSGDTACKIPNLDLGLDED